MAKGTARKARLTGELATALVTLKELVAGDEEFLKGDGRFTAKARQQFYLPADTHHGILSHAAVLGDKQLGQLLSSVQQSIGTLRLRERQLAEQERLAEAARLAEQGQSRPSYAFA